ncbi:hypothetical protein niasHT_002200 [Heterodera trifolii]|uniref:14-3-3 domain-containing protein n=1 Tax=Heterodera trifolii TaxID=157864 RepID=A0ABD2LXR8_9BILA
MVEAMKKLIKLDPNLGLEDRVSLAVAYKGAMSSRRSSWRMLVSIEERTGPEMNERQHQVMKSYRVHVQNELVTICQELLTCINEVLFPKATDPEPKVFYLKMKADYYRYMAEVATDEDRSRVVELAKAAYQEAMETLYIVKNAIIWSAVILLLVDFATIPFWFFLDNAKKRRRPRKKEIFICSDCWLLVFDFLAPSQLGLEIALISHRFDFYVNEHFKTRKWKLNKQFLIQWDIQENGTKKMQIVNSDENPLPIPQNPLPNKVIGFYDIQIIYIDQNVVAFLRRFHRHIFAVCTVDLYIITENVRIFDFVMLSIWPMFRHSMHVLYLNSIAFSRLRQLAPSLLSECLSLRFVSFKDAILPEFPHDESANASDGQAVAKWLLTLRPDGVPKLFQCSVNSTEEQWSSMMEQLKAAFFNASPVTFRIHFRSSSPLHSVMPFDLINDVTGEKLMLRQSANNFWLDRCPIGWDDNWENVCKEVNARPNPIEIRIRDGGYDDGVLLDAASPESSDH